LFVRARWFGPLMVVVVAISAVLTTTEPASAEPATKKAAIAAYMHYVDMANKRQYAQLYAVLYPGQQRLLPKATFTACMKTTLKGVTYKTGRLVKTEYEVATVPGTSDQVRPLVITTTLTAVSGSVKRRSTETHREIYVNGKWRWALSGEYISDCIANQRPPA